MSSADICSSATVAGGVSGDDPADLRVGQRAAVAFGPQDVDGGVCWLITPVSRSRTGAGATVRGRTGRTGRTGPAAWQDRSVTATLKAAGLGAGFGARTLFTGLDLVVAPGDVVGLVGANGAGKSTLLRLLAGIDAPADGRVTLSPDRRHRRLPAAGGRAARRRDGGRAPRAAHRGRRRPAAARRRDRGADRRRHRAPTTRYAGRPWTAGWRSAAPTWTSRTDAVLADLGSTVDPSSCR